MDLKEIDKKIAELQKLRVEAEKQAEQERLQKEHQEAVDIITRLLDDVRRLAEIGYLPPRLMTALSDNTGKFNPGMYIKRPKKRDAAQA